VSLGQNEPVEGKYGFLSDFASGIPSVDLLAFVSVDSRVLYQNWNGDPSLLVREDTVLQTALKQKRASEGSVLLPAEVVDSLPEALRQRSQILIQSGEKVEQEKRLRSAIALAAAVPVPLNSNEPVGYLYACSLLAGRHEIVDSIKESVFKNETHNNQEIGTATIFQDSVRVSTNVRRTDGSRAVGTVLSAEVKEAVLNQGRVWSDRAFVLNDWFLTAYEPIRDPRGRIIGALYVGVMEAPYLYKQGVINKVFLGLLFLAASATLLLAYFVVRHLLLPIERVVTVVKKIMRGDFQSRVEIRPAGEMGLLCRAVDAMAEAVEGREQRLKESAQRQIGQAEKLASIGRLAAGVAHEINNPLTGVLTFAHLLAENGALEGRNREDLDVIIRETTRVKEIVQGLLEFSREAPACKISFDINQTIEHLIRLVKSQGEFDNVVVSMRLADEPMLVYGDRAQLQQVLLNLIINGCQAMPLGGELEIQTEKDGGKVVISVSDTGEGIKEENRQRLFDPFFTTKPAGKGTGLGLSISYGIVKQHAGDIELETEEGGGSTFRVILPQSEPKDVLLGEFS
jgi:two-component system NtrC family sensor kinase